MRLILLAAAFAPSLAFADQCAYLDAAAAERAVAVLKPGLSWITWCEPCGEATPGTARTIGEVKATPVPDSTYVEVSIDGAPIDLAYVFVQDRPGKPAYRNLASLAKCPAQGVSRSIPGPTPTAPAP